MEHMRQVEKEKEEEKIEGDNLRRLAVANALERQRLEQIAAQEQQEMMKENLRQIADCKKMREVQRLQEEADEEDCRLFAAGKRKMLKLRQERERQLHEDKQKTLSAIRDRLSSQLKALKVRRWVLVFGKSNLTFFFELTPVNTGFRHSLLPSNRARVDPSHLLVVEKMTSRSSR